jgi:hypothetical protein
VLAVPNSALRTQKDVASAAEVLGLTADQVQSQLAARTDTTARAAATVARPGAAAAAPAGASTMTLPNGRTVTLPAGVTEAQVQAIFRKRTSGEQISTEERALLRQVFQGMGAGGAGGGSPGGRAREGTADTRFGGKYIVFVRREGKPVATSISTGLTDLDYSEVTSGLTEQDSVLILPSASLVQAQKEFTQRVQRMTGGGGIPGMSSGSQSGSKASTATPGRP